ncbi:MAG: glycosyltransferase family 2 protein [Pirellulaceae bacterium]
MHRLSIVIPCRVVDERVEETLVSVLENRPRDCQVVVVTAVPYEDPYDLADEVCFVASDGQATPVQLVNRGFQEATADIVHVLMPGTRVVEGWTANVPEHFTIAEVAMVAPVVVESATDHRALCVGIGYRASGVRRVIGAGTRLAGRPLATSAVLGPSLVAGFYRRDVVAALGYFDERMEPACADIDMALAAHELGLVAVVEPTCRVLCERAAVRPLGGFRSSRHLERLYRRYARAGWWTTFCHSLVAAWDVVCCFPHPGLLARLVGRIVARLESGVALRQRQRLEDAAVELAQRTEPTPSIAIRGDFERPREKAIPSARRRRAA